MPPGTKTLWPQSGRHRCCVTTNDAARSAVLRRQYKTLPHTLYEMPTTPVVSESPSTRTEKRLDVTLLMTPGVCPVTIINLPYRLPQLPVCCVPCLKFTQITRLPSSFPAHKIKTNKQTQAQKEHAAVMVFQNTPSARPQVHCVQNPLLDTCTYRIA